jgi:hypothetical protein
MGATEVNICCCTLAAICAIGTGLFVELLPLQHATL